MAGRPVRAGRVLLAVQAGLGSLHIALLTPLPTVLSHLAVVQSLWTAFAFFAFDRLEVREAAA